MFIFLRCEAPSQPQSFLHVMPSCGTGIGCIAASHSGFWRYTAAIFAAAERSFSGALSHIVWCENHNRKPHFSVMLELLNEGAPLVRLLMQNDRFNAQFL